MQERINKTFLPIQNKLVNYALIIFSVIGIILYPFTIIRDINHLSKENIILGIITLCVIIVAYYRHRLSINHKIIVICILGLLLVINGLVLNGFLATAKVYICIIPIFTSFILPQKKSIFILLLFLATISIFAYLYSSGYLKHNFELNEYVTKPQVWIVDILVIFMASLSILLVGHLYNKTIKENLLEIKLKNLELESHRKNLENLVFERTKELEDSLEREKELGILKTNFVSMASHEFRTPLATIQAASDVILRYSDKLSKKDIEKRLYKIKNEIKDMTNILEDILIVGKSYADKIIFNPSKINIVSFIKNIISEMQLANAEQREVIYILSSNSIIITVDEKLIKNIVTNLVSNAFKYSSSDSPIEINIKQVDNSVFLSISDQGIGIPKKDLEMIFTPFHRGENTEEISGTGLGLTVLKKAVEMHKGEIKVKSKLNEGTTFEIILPLT